MKTQINDTNMKLGKIKQIKDIRSVWHHEARDFSKWLALDENLGQLSDAIGIDIVLEEREARLEISMLIYMPLKRGPKDVL